MPTSPHLNWLIRFIYAPQVNVFALASDSECLIILPVYLDALQLWVQLSVHKLGHILLQGALSLGNPDCYDARVAPSRH